MRATACSARASARRVSAEPLARTVSLLARGVDDPLLRLRVDDFGGHPIEPGVCKLRVAHSPPQLADQVRQHRSLVARDPVEALERLLELPTRLAPEVPFGFDIPLVHPTP